ncbi:hypothetical protein VTK73DRAFT_6219 [Phialemonium thermophilum]|uniref:Uncharacterized protein n=1 Tax=Phialemonium thermophilum TaxID=223376 RepID=A0ABR3XVZ3_9PEZI
MVPQSLDCANQPRPRSADCGSSSAHAPDEDNRLMTYADDEREEEEVVEEGDEREEDGLHEQQGYLSSHAELHNSHHHHHHHHHLHHHHHQHSHHQQYVLYDHQYHQSHPSAVHLDHYHHQNEEVYPALQFDDGDDAANMSEADGGGAPLVNYLDIANLLTNEVEMGESSNGSGATLSLDFSHDVSDILDMTDDDHNAPASDETTLHPAHSPHPVHPTHPVHHVHLHSTHPVYPTHPSHLTIPHHSYSSVHPLNSVLPFNPVHSFNSISTLAAEFSWPLDGPIMSPPLHAPVLNPGMMSQQLQMYAGDLHDHDAMSFLFNSDHPAGLVNPNAANTLGPSNYGLVNFLKFWAGQRPGYQAARLRLQFPWMDRIMELSSSHLTHVQYADLDGDQCDFQGLDWKDIGVTRKAARERRLLTYKNYVNKEGSDRWHPELPDLLLPQIDNFFRFRRMDIRRDVHLSHFQLRNVLASPSRTKVFYTGNGVVHGFNPVTGESKQVLRATDAPASQISTLTADYGLLIAGSFTGEYLLRELDTWDEDDAPCHEGTITTHVSGITNHVQLFRPRQASTPRAAFASNDMCFRVLDIASETFVTQESFEYPLNCTALSPDRRLRVMVGDHQNVLIAAAESTRGDGRPEIIFELGGHRDHGFACDWADDGWTVATAFQDRAVKIWDARRWTDSSGVAIPVCTMRTEMAGVRSLRFSPVGSGKRVLVAAEEADFVNIIDAQTYRSKQTIDLFGEIGGVSFGNDGQDLLVLCCDNVRGGIMQLERCGLGAEATFHVDATWRTGDTWRDRKNGHDWPRSHFTEERRIREAVTKRRFKSTKLDAIEPF